MRAAFNVLKDGWIPVTARDGTRCKLGILETLARAPELTAISEASPLAEYSIYRFLTVFLMDALRPEKLGTMRKMLSQGSFDMAKIEAYVAECEKEGVSFDLFDEKRPFLQNAYTDKERKPVSALDCTLPTGNNHTHFDHRSPDNIAISPDEAMKLLLTAYEFCTSGAQGYPSGVNASPPYFSVIKGENLFQTLVFLMVPMDSISIDFDSPAALWREKNGVTPKKEVGRTSWLRGMLFPTRKICLLPDDDGFVRSVYYCQGENYVNKESWRDPHVTYRTTDSGIVPLRPHRDVPVWKNLDDIIDIPGQHAPRILEQYQRLCGTEHAAITLYGVETSQASYLSIMRFSIEIPMSVASEPARIEWLTACLSDADAFGRTLRGCLSDSGVIPAEQIAEALNLYYEQCEHRLWPVCDAAGSAGESELIVLRDQWKKDLGSLALSVYDETTARIKLRGRDLGRVSTAKRGIYFAIKKSKEG